MSNKEIAYYTKKGAKEPQGIIDVTDVKSAGKVIMAVWQGGVRMPALLATMRHCLLRSHEFLDPTLRHPT